jgi:hypothetical protein
MMEQNIVSTKPPHYLFNASEWDCYAPILPALHSFPGWGNNILKTINQKKLNEVLISWQCPVNWIVLKPVYFSTFGIYHYFIIPLKYVLSVSIIILQSALAGPFGTPKIKKK